MSFVLSLTACVLGGCAKENPLTDIQKQQVSSRLDSAGQAYNAIRANISPLPSDRLFKGNLFLNEASISAPTVKMRGILKEKIKSGSCRVRLISPEAYEPNLLIATDRAEATRRSFIVVKVSGEPNCPVRLEFKITTLLDPSIGRFAISYDYSYSVNEDGYRELNDIDSIELHGGISYNGLNLDKVRSETDLKGSIHSQSDGLIPITASGKLRGASRDSLNGTIEWKFDYPSFSAEFRKSYDSGDLSFSLNRQSMEREDYDRYFAQGGEPFLLGSNSDLIH